MSNPVKASRLSGPGAALFLVVAGFFANVGSAPSPYRASTAELVEHYAGQGQNLDIAAVLRLFAAALIVVFVSGLWMRFCDVPAADASGWAMIGLVGGGGLAVVTMFVAGAQVSLAGLATLDEPGSQVVRGAAVAAAAAMQVAAMAAVPMLAGFGIAGLRFAVHGRWLAWVAVAAAISGILGVLPDVAAAWSLVFAELLALLGQLELPLLVLWMIGVSLSSGPQEHEGEEGYPPSPPRGQVRTRGKH